MQKQFLLFLSCFYLLIASCQFSKGVKKDLNTGLSASYNGLSIDDIYLADADGKKLSDNIVSLGTPIQIVTIGTHYFTESGGKVFPGCTIILTDKDKNKKELLNLPDAFADMEQGTTPDQAATLQAKLNTGEPMQVGETYVLSVHFFDKKNKENYIDATVNIVMK